ncbi:MAG: CDP-diacylglycerol--serine O-phosphatidyltransferase [Cytophagales bacterium]|nr:MAG: CDP-diacylglycerol--serine O-phosphatidyltransferase [Cytophagales bacterium]
MTCGNLLCGSVAIVLAMQGHLAMASWLMIVAGILDFGDGFAARWLNVTGPFGKELDSLADMVTFGLLPAILVFQLCTQMGWGNWAYAAFLIVVLSALRLAKFNIDTRQSYGFIGVPTPANGLMIAAFPLMGLYQPSLNSIWQNDIVLGAIILFSFMLVTELPLMAFKFKSFGWAENRVKYIFLGLSALLLLVLQFAALPIIVGLYIVFSLVFK